jgi:hypothetical protein
MGKPWRVAVDQHGFQRETMKHDGSTPIELTYYSGFQDVFADIEDVQVGDAATVMYLESDRIADGVVSAIKPDDESRPWLGGLIYITTDLRTARDDG